MRSETELTSPIEARTGTAQRPPKAAGASTNRGPFHHGKQRVIYRIRAPSMTVLYIGYGTPRACRPISFSGLEAALLENFFLVPGPGRCAVTLVRLRGSTRDRPTTTTNTDHTTYPPPTCDPPVFSSATGVAYRTRRTTAAPSRLSSPTPNSRPLPSRSPPT